MFILNYGFFMLCRTEISATVATLEGSDPPTFPDEHQLLNSGFPLQFPWYVSRNNASATTNWLDVDATFTSIHTNCDAPEWFLIGKW